MLTTKQGFMYNAGQGTLLEKAVRHGDAMTCSLVIYFAVNDDYRKQGRNSLLKKRIKYYFYEWRHEQKEQSE